jgi:hypothetical protein
MRASPCVALVTVMALAVSAASCSVPAEQTIISDFFAASRLRDLTALSRFSTVVFEPAEQGTVSSFRIERVSAEQLDGGLRTKQVGIRAEVFGADGRTTERPIVVRLQRRDGDARTLYGGWIVTGITASEPAPAPTNAPTR